MGKHPNRPRYIVEPVGHGFAVDVHRPQRTTRLAMFVRPCAAIIFARKASASGALVSQLRKRGLAHG